MFSEAGRGGAKTGDAAGAGFGGGGGDEGCAGAACRHRDGPCGGDSLTQAATHGYQRALLVGACIVLAATVIALLTPNTRQTTTVAEEKPEDAALELAA